MLDDVKQALDKHAIAKLDMKALLEQVNMIVQSFYLVFAMQLLYTLSISKFIESN